MKKIYTFLLVSLMLSSQVSAQGLEWFDPIKETNFSFMAPEMKLVLKSGVGVQEEKQAGNWIKDTRLTGTQDAKGNQTAFITESWDTATNAWVIDSYITNQLNYDAAGKVISSYMLIMAEGEKVMSKTFTYTYDGSGKYLPVRSIDSVFGDVEMNYVTTDSIVYDGSGKIVERLESITLTGMYIPKTRKTYSYDATNNITGVLIEEHDGAGWGDIQRFTLTYNAANKMLTQLEENFDGTNWDINQSDSFTYNASNVLVSHVNYFYNGTSFIIDNHSTYTFTGSTLSQLIEKNWNGSSLENENKVVLNYNSGALETVHFFKWLGSDFETDYSQRITFSGGSVGLKSANIATLTLFPNPAQSQIEIAGLNATAQLQILDLQGKILSNEIVSVNNNAVNIAHLETGIYLVQIKVGEQIIVKRLVKD